MFRDGKVLSVLLNDRERAQLASIKWAAFKAPPLVYDRDFVYMDYSDAHVVDSQGRRCAVLAVSRLLLLLLTATPHTTTACVCVSCRRSSPLSTPTRRPSRTPTCEVRRRDRVTCRCCCTVFDTCMWCTSIATQVKSSCLATSCGS
jgi:hypothetical protein